MADTKLTETQVADLVATIRSDAAVDAKVHAVNVAKSGIKQHNVPDACVPQLFDGLRLASSAQHAALVTTGFTALNHLLTRLSRQDPKLLAKEAVRTLPLIVEKLGDQKDKLRSTATQGLNTLYLAAPAEVERSIRNTALTGKNPRAKESGMQWLLQTHQEQGLQFRSYVPLLMELLEDADGMVRDTAKNTVIELFKTAPNTAKSDLKRQLKNFKVRPAIEQAIVKALAPTGTRPETPSEAAPSSRPALAASVSSAMSDRPVTPMAEPAAEPAEPQYVNTTRELDDIFRDMAFHFEGRETEQNWLKREEAMGTLRRLNTGNAPSDFHDAFLAGLRRLLDGIIKAMTSLRTSLSKEGCALVQDVARTFGPAMDPLVELLLQTLIKLCAGTKKISSQLANTTVDIILSRVTYTPRLMQHVWGACQDKNVQPRTYAAGWLKTLLHKEAAHKNHVEHTGGVDLMEKCIKKGLADPNPGVREKMRSAYWAFWGVWPARADAIMADLDATAQKLLNKDPNNPNSPNKGEAPRPGLGLSRSTMTASKPSLRETMLAQKKATLSVKNKLPPRPGSAMANMSPVRKVSDPSQPSATTSKPSGTRVRPEAGTLSVNASGMSVAPMRPTRRRPETITRPATAGPYSVRDQPSSMEADSPGTLRSRPAPSLRAKDPTPRRTAPRPRPGHASHASESSIINSPTSKTVRKGAPSPKTSPARMKKAQSAQTPASPPKAAEEAPLVVPTITTLNPPDLKINDENEAPAQPVESEPAEPEPAKPEPVEVQQPINVAISDLSLESPVERPAPEPVKVYEDPFTEQTAKPTITVPVLESKPVNEDAAGLRNANGNAISATEGPDSPEKEKQNTRLLDSGISKIKAKTLEVHGFRKLQSLLRDSRTVFTDDRLEAFLMGMFHYLEDPLTGTPTDKALDIKAQILTTIKLLLKRERDNFRPHVSQCLESLLQTRSAYDGRAHIVSGLEMLADELVAIGDGSEIVVVVGRRLQDCTDASVEGCRALSMGLHILRQMLEHNQHAEVELSEAELLQLSSLARRCLESPDSGVRMSAVQLCVTMHARLGEARFWDAMRDVKDDPKSLITYYIVKRQREQGVAASPSA